MGKLLVLGAVSQHFPIPQKRNTSICGRNPRCEDCYPAGFATSRLTSTPCKHHPTARWKAGLVTYKNTNTMTSTDYLHFAESFFKDCIELSRKKTADYTENGADAFANFRQIPENWTEIGFLTRMGDKMARLRSFVQNGDLQVKDESATDTLRDLANYCALFAAYLGEQKKDGDSVQNATVMVRIVYA